MEPKIILIDMDMVLVDLVGGVNKMLGEYFPDVTPILAEDLEWDFASYPGHIIPHIEGFLAVPGFFQSLEPIHGSIQAVHEMRAEGHDIFICTSPLLMHEKQSVWEKYDWIEWHLGVEFAEVMMPAHDKTLVHADFLIDDRPDISGLREHDPTWEHIVFGDYRYNRHITCKRRLTDLCDWRDVVQANGEEQCEQ